MTYESCKSKVANLKMLDCFCGLGGASEGFHREGFECTGIDIVNVGYPYRLILADMLTLKGEDFRGYDVIWGSPPCRDFTKLPDHWVHKDGSKGQWKIPKNPENGIKLVQAFGRFVSDARPTFWIMENVKGLADFDWLHIYLPKARIYGAKLHLGKQHAFWGNFPEFLLPHAYSQMCNQDVQGKLRAWERAKIPLACSQAFARACKEALLEKEAIA